MKKILSTAILVLFLFGSVLAGVLKFDFTISNSDGSTTIVEVSSRTNKHGNVTVCGYNDQATGAFLGEIQGSSDGSESGAESFCRSNAPVR